MILIEKRVLPYGEYYDLVHVSEAGTKTRIDTVTKNELFNIFQEIERWL